MQAEGLIGIGLYSVSEASILARVPTRQIRRWLYGYSFQYRGRTHVSAPILEPEPPEIDDHQALSFLDLMELRFIRAFREAGVGLPTIREAARRACQLFDANHPFARQRFRTDGRYIFADIADVTEDRQQRVLLLNLTRNQYAFREVVEPSLYRSMEYSAEGDAALWFPQFPRRSIVVDPRRSFGRPIVSKYAIPTDTLAAAVEAEGSAERAARLYEVPLSAVRSAVEFQQSLVG